jgi:hypothetical protein
MIQDLFSKLFISITEIQCWDLNDGTCVDEVNNVITNVSNTFYLNSLIITILFILIAAIPKYSFKWKFLNDIVIRRISFILGMLFSSYLLFAAWSTAIYLCSQRSEDADIAKETFVSLASMSYYISYAIFPIVFFFVAWIFDKFFKRRKLFTIFKSNNKIFGLI